MPLIVISYTLLLKSMDLYLEGTVTANLHNYMEESEY
jgi:hypothetical protein